MLIGGVAVGGGDGLEAVVITDVRHLFYCGFIYEDEAEVEGGGDLVLGFHWESGQDEYKEDEEMFYLLFHFD